MSDITDELQQLCQEIASTHPLNQTEMDTCWTALNDLQMKSQIGISALLPAASSIAVADYQVRLLTDTPAPVADLPWPASCRCGAVAVVQRPDNFMIASG